MSYERKSLYLAEIFRNIILGALLKANLYRLPTGIGVFNIIYIHPNLITTVNN